MSVAKNKNLGAARRAKNDEFYTQRADIENELRHYDHHFKGKVVYCNCDDPRVSEFYLYFKRKFKILGLKKLIAATYRNPYPDARRGQEDLLAEEAEKYETEQAEKANQPAPPIKQRQAVYIEYCGGKTGRPPIMLGDGVYHGGDFRSKESIALLKQADIVVTNPPFSLFREYVAHLMEYEKKFVVIGPVNALHYKDTFKLFLDGKIWLGHRFNRGNAYFGVPNPKDYSEGVYDESTGLVKFRNVLWFTNLDINKRHEDLLLSKRYNEADYPKYDNYDAIEVGKVKEIPLDYDGVMGVPDTFLQDHNPDQFELLDNVGDAKVNGKAKYSRMLIRHKHPQK